MIPKIQNFLRNLDEIGLMDGMAFLPADVGQYEYRPNPCLSARDNKLVKKRKVR